MEKVIVDGSEVDVKVEVKEGKIVLLADYAGKGGNAKVELAVGVDYFLDKLAERIPGTIDDAVLAVVKQALKLV